MQLSLDGVKLGRRIGFNTAKQKAAALILEHVTDISEALKIQKLILSLEDK
jgi:hypothetical protein